MQDDDGFTNATLSLRIVHIDHYLHPLRDYSSSVPFQAARLTHSTAQSLPKLPVIRIFGSTPAGQSCCLHIHGVRPYLYLPLPAHVPPNAAFDFAKKLREALDSTLRNAYAAEGAPQNPPTEGGPIDTDPTVYIAEIEPVLKTDIYGYYPHPRLFLKVHTYNPRSVSRIAAIVGQRGLPEELVPGGTQIYSAHIPFHMQFLVDHDLAGMAYLNLADFRFRKPLPSANVKGRNALQLFSRRNAERLFVDGLDEVKPNLFWPFHVAKRSTCELELDSFTQHILNARVTESEDGEYSFVSRTLGVLWNEERLRTGNYPPREKPTERPIQAGGHLSEPMLQGKLKEVLSVEVEGPKKDINDLEDSLATQKESESQSQIPASYEDVLNVLDASGSFGAASEEDGLIGDFDDEDADEIEDPDVFWRGELKANGRVERIEDNPEVVRRDWEDIADCTQNLSGLEDIDEPNGDAAHADGTGFRVHSNVDKDLDTAISKADKVEEKPASNDEISVERGETPRPNGKAAQPARSPGKDSVFDTAFDEIPTAPRSVSQSEVAHASQRIEKSGESNIYIRPIKRPPSASFLAQERTPGDAFSIKFVTPFYGDKEDEVTRREAFGGLIIPVRASGAAGYEPFPAYFDYSKATVEVAPRVIRPAERPPTLAKLKASLIQDASGFKNSTSARFVIDSAGRQVQQRDEGSLRDPLSLSNNPAVDIAPKDEVRNLSGVLDSDSDSDSSENSVKATYSVEQPNSKATTDASEYENLIQNRPLSPKYDEGYQHYVLPNTNSNHARAGETPKRRLLDSVTRKVDGSDASKYARNSTVSLSESMHRFQNMTVMSIELIASCYSNKLPDPSQNEVLAICSIVERDQLDLDGRGASCVLFTGSKCRLPKGLRLTILAYESETQLLDAFAAHIRREDPDVLVGYETQNSSVGFILERAHAISHPFAQASSRWLKGTGFDGNARIGQNSNSAAAAYYHRKGADIKITGRHVLSLWRIVRKEVKLPAYSKESVAAELFQMTFPRHTDRDMEDWLSSQRHSARSFRHLIRLNSLNLAILEKLNILSRTGELARVFGVDFMSVLTRGSQFRVESMLGRVARKRDFLLLSAAREEVFQQPAVEALPLVMEPQSALYVDPVIVLDFQSLYPSVIIAHNLCFSTMLGNLNRISSWSEERRIGVLPKYSPVPCNDASAVPQDNIFVSSCGEMFVDSSVRRGILPQLLKEILETRVMVKKAMKGIVGDEATAGMLNARQFGLKMIANVTYGYTAASFSGRMPCAGLADAIVQCGRDALEEIVRYVEEELRSETGATVVYGDTDSLFVQTPGCTIDEAFEIGERIVAHAATIFPDPITLKLEKVYQPCILQTKKRYVGYSFESKSQAVPIFDAKGIETVRRDSCPLVQKALEKAIRILFESKNVSLVKKYIQRLCQKLHLDRIPFGDYIFRKEVRLGSYKEGHLPPAAIVATKAIENDPRAVPRHGERVSFVVLYDRPGAPLKDCVVSPEHYLEAACQGLARLNTTYYITKQILPALNRVFSLIGVRVSGWYAEIPRPMYDLIVKGKEREKKVRAGQSSLHMFYTTEKCAICHGKGVERQICNECIESVAGTQASRFLLDARLREHEINRAQLVRKCFGCVADHAGGRNEVRCCNLLCPVYDELGVIDKKVSGLRQILDDSTVWKV